MNQSIVRAVIAIIFAITVAVGFFLDKVSSEVFLSLVSSTITYFFVRDSQERATKAVIQAMVSTADAQKTA